MFPSSARDGRISNSKGQVLFCRPWVLPFPEMLLPRAGFELVTCSCKFRDFPFRDKDSPFLIHSFVYSHQNRKAVLAS